MASINFLCQEKIACKTQICFSIKSMKNRYGDIKEKSPNIESRNNPCDPVVQ